MAEVLHHNPISATPYTLNPKPVLQDGHDLTTPRHPAPFSFPSLQPTADGAPSASLNSPISNTYSHRRARTSLHGTGHTPLPDYRFGASTMQETASNVPTSDARLSPPGDLQSLPGRSRHRRGLSEIGGALNAQHTPVTPFLPSSQSAYPVLGSTDVNIPTHRGHRHRRSGTAASQDLTSLLSSSVVPIAGEMNEHFSFGGDQSQQDNKISEAKMSAEQLNETPVAPPIRMVEFSDTIEVIPRPISMVSSESGSSQSTIRETAQRREAGASAEFSNLRILTSLENMSTPSFQQQNNTNTINEQTFGNEAGIDASDLNLSANFDDEHLTSTVVSPAAGGIDWSNLESSPTASPMLPSHHSTPPLPISSSFSAGMIDLDEATPGFSRPASASGYERKRASMASFNQSSGFLSSSSYRHRRTESAPSLVPPGFSASFRNPSSSGESPQNEHILEDVFEEEEEETQGTLGSVQESHAPLACPAVHVQQDRLMEPGVLQTHREVHSSPCLLPAISFELPNAADRPASQSLVEGTFDLPRPHPPFHNTDHTGVTAMSSPKCSHSLLSTHSCEPSPRYRKSIDDVPSLISGASTIDSSAQPAFSFGTRSGGTEGSFADSSYSLASSSRQYRKDHKKKASIISLSRWVSGYSKSENQLSSFSSIERPQTSIDPRPTGTSKKGHRLSRMLKAWSKPFKKDDAKKTSEVE